MKFCRDCEGTKPISEFNADARNPDKKQTYCRDCQKLRAKNWYKNPKNKVAKRNKDLITKFNITLDEFNALIASQNNACAICKHAFSHAKNANMDHCHASGGLREVLCRQCNIGLGLFKDSVQTLETAIQYLIKHK